MAAQSNGHSPSHEHHYTNIALESNISNSAQEADGKHYNQEPKIDCCCFQLAHRSLCYVLPVIHPYHMGKLCWDVLIIIALLISSVHIPFAMAFDLPASTDSGIGVFSLMIDLVLCLDILVQLRTAYFDEFDPLRLITNPVLIAKKYLSFWFWFDLLTSFPFSVILGSEDDRGGIPQYLKVLRIIRLIRIFRVVRIFRLLNETSGRFKLSPSTTYKLEIVKILFTYLFVAHLFACLWWSVGVWTSHSEDMTTWIESRGLTVDIDSLALNYTTSLYWSVVTLFTTGYGDISASADNIAECWTAIFCVAVGSLLTAWFIGTFSSLLLEGSEKQRMQNSAVDSAIAFCNHYGLDRELQTAVVSQTKYFYSYNFDILRTDEVMQCLPSGLQKRIKQQLAERCIRQIGIFQTLHQEVLGALYLKLRAISCHEGYVLYSKGDIATQFYIQRVGHSHALDESGTQIKKLRFKRGAVIGIDCVSSTGVVHRTHTVACTTFSEFYVLQKKDVFDAIRNFYGDEVELHKWVANHRVGQPHPSSYVLAEEKTLKPHSPNANSHRKSVHHDHIRFASVEEIDLNCVNSFTFLHSPNKSQLQKSGRQQTAVEQNGMDTWNSAGVADDDNQVPADVALAEQIPLKQSSSSSLTMSQCTCVPEAAEESDHKQQATNEVEIQLAPIVMQQSTSPSSKCKTDDSGGNKLKLHQQLLGHFQRTKSKPNKFGKKLARNQSALRNEKLRKHYRKTTKSTSPHLYMYDDSEDSTARSE